MKACALLFAALLVVISGCATTAPDTRSAAQLQDLGEKSLAAGETADALKYLTEAAQKKPGDAMIEYYLALAYDQRGLQDKALSHLQNALKLKPAFPEALNTIGYIYATRGQFDKAREAFQKALDDPFYKTPQFAACNLGRLYENKGEPERALSYYQQAVKFDQNYGLAWLRAGHVLEQLNRNDEARHAYGNAIHASPDMAAPDMARAHLRFGILSYMAGDLGTAVRSLNEVGRISPNTDMADEARRYLDKIESAPQKKERPRFTPQISPGDVELNSGSESQAYLYVVQLGSFSDRQKAEDLLQQLQQKGYRASVRTREDHELGTVFVVQLEPVNSISRATTLVTQLSGQTEGEPVIIKLRYDR